MDEFAFNAACNFGHVCVNGLVPPAWTLGELVTPAAVCVLADWLVESPGDDDIDEEVVALLAHPAKTTARPAMAKTPVFMVGSMPQRSDTVTVFVDPLLHGG